MTRCGGGGGGELIRDGSETAAAGSCRVLRRTVRVRVTAQRCSGRRNEKLLCLGSAQVDDVTVGAPVCFGRGAWDRLASPRLPRYHVSGALAKACQAEYHAYQIVAVCSWGIQKRHLGGGGGRRPGGRCRVPQAVAPVL